MECCGSADRLAPFDRSPSAIVPVHLVFVEFLVFIRNVRKVGGRCEEQLLPAVVPSLSALKGELPASQQVPFAPNPGGIHPKSGVLTMFLGHGGENVNIVFKPVLTGGFLLGTFKKKWRRHPVSLVVLVQSLESPSPHSSFTHNATRSGLLAAALTRRRRFVSKG